jgi:hypothetical protein
VGGAVQPAVGQPIDPRDLPGGAFGQRTAREYSGAISWSWNTGSAREAAEIGVRNGELHCVVTYTNEEGTYSASGPGMIDISLGLPPDEEWPPSQRRGKAYSFRVACPSAAPDAPPGANWAHSQDTYKQPGGEVGIDPGTGGAVVPDVLEGSWDAQSEDGGEQTRMTWKLCKAGCAPPPLPEAP